MGSGAAGWLGLPGAAWLGWFDWLVFFFFLILFVFGNLYAFDGYPSSEDHTLTRIKCEISGDSQTCDGIVGVF